VIYVEFYLKGFPLAAAGKIIHGTSEQGQELNFTGKKDINVVLSMYF